MGWLRIDLAGSRVACTDRRGGRSAAPYATLNLSPFVGDDPRAVDENRHEAARVLAAGATPDAMAPDRWVPLRQVHGTEVATASDGIGPEVEADAVVLTAPGTVGLIVTADCVPLALVARGGVAAVHAGWHGLLAGVVERSVAALQEAAGPPVAAVLGACIRPCCYEFGAEDLDRVSARYGAGVASTTRSGALALDLPAGVRAALRAAGCSATPVLDLGACTACSADWFSHRRDGAAPGGTGRQGLLVTRLADVTR